MNTQDTKQNTEQSTLPFPESVPDATGGAPDGQTLTDLQAENNRLKEQLRLRDAHEDLTHKLKKAGAKTPKLLLAAAKHALKFTGEGMLENAGEVVDDLLDRFPEQFGHNTSPKTHTSIDAGSGRNSKPALTRETLAKMKPEEIAKLDWNDVRRVLSN
jgi:hypothetical protein